jgi:hypothetical protein
MKMKILNYLMIIAGCLVATVGCRQKDIMIYENDPRVYFELPGYGGVGIRDSLVFSFPVTQEQTVDLSVRIRLMGEAAPHARHIAIGVVAGETTADVSNYSLPTIIALPPNAYYVDVPITIRRAGLLNKSVVLVLEIKTNENFGIGFERGRKTKMIWGDMYLKPDNWDSSNYRNCFGEFSQVKYAFILATCGILELPLPTDIYMLGYYNGLVREALYEYNSSHTTPLTDENGGPVTIPVWNGGGGGLG